MSEQSISNISINESILDLKDEQARNLAQGALKSNLLGQPNGICPLNSNGKINAEYLTTIYKNITPYPSRNSFPATGEEGRLYIDESTNYPYYWKNNAYNVLELYMDFNTIDNRPLYNGTAMSSTTSIPEVKTQVWDEKQDKLIAGQNITINENNVISCNSAISLNYDTLSNKPKYKNETITSQTNIPEVKTNSWDAKYDLPESGIPLTDLSTNITAKLDKADSAMQGFKVTFTMTNTNPITYIADKTNAEIYGAFTSGKYVYGCTGQDTDDQRNIIYCFMATENKALFCNTYLSEGDKYLDTLMIFNNTTTFISKNLIAQGDYISSIYLVWNGMTVDYALTTIFNAVEKKIESFPVTITKQNNVWSSDKTAAEIYAAFQAKKDVYAIYDNKRFELMHIEYVENNSKIIFTSVGISESGVTTIMSINIINNVVLYSTSGLQKLINDSNKLSASYINGLSNVATSGNYNDLSNKPTNVSSFVNDAGYLTQHQSLLNYRTSAAQDIIDNTLDERLDTLESYIPQEVTSSNQLADKNFVNSSISSNTSTFRGTSAAGLTEAQFLAWANTLTKTNNDYIFWNTVDDNNNVVFKRYKYNGTEWVYEYSLNNSSFTASQWSAINSGITSADVEEIANKEDTSNKVTNITSSSTDIQYPTAKAVYDLTSEISTDLQTLLALKEDVSNKVDTIDSSSTDEQYPTALAVYNITSDMAWELIDMLDEKQDIIDESNKLSASYITGLAAVATSGSYNDLTNKPTNVSSFTNDAGYLTQHQSLANYRTSNAQDTIDNGKANVSESGYSLSANGTSVSLKNKSGTVLSTITTQDTNTWVANSSSTAGYVASGAGKANKVWKTDSNGNPAWRDESGGSNGIINGIGASTLRSVQLNEDPDRTTVNTFVLNNPQSEYHGDTFKAGTGTDTYNPADNRRGYYAIVMNEASFACGNNAIALGHNCVAKGDCSHAEGESTVASGGNARSTGRYTVASGFNSLAEGWGSVASGNQTRAGGFFTKAIGSRAYSNGVNTIAAGENSFTSGEGSNTGLYGFTSTDHTKATLTFVLDSVEGLSVGDTFSCFNAVSGNGWNDVSTIATIDTTTNTITVTSWGSMSFSRKTDLCYFWVFDKPMIGTTLLNSNISGMENYGFNSAVFGKNTSAVGNRAFANGYETQARGNNTFSCGYKNKSISANSFTSGRLTTASGMNAHAEGEGCTASGENSHAEGEYCTASGKSSHAEGSFTSASGTYSHAEGTYTSTAGPNQHVQGKYNIIDSTSAHIVGNGISTVIRSNIHTLDWNGNAWFAGDVYTGSTSGTNKDSGSKKLESTGNKVVSISSSSTDDQYPSAKCVYDLVGNLEALLLALR